MSGRILVLVGILALALVMLFFAHLAFGPVDIPIADVWSALFHADVGNASTTIVRDVRLPEATTAVLVGAALGTSGVLMQTLFMNPLAGPGVLGITSGAGLGVALLYLGSGLFPTMAVASGSSLVVGAVLGAFSVLLIIVFADERVRDGVTLLIVGLMIGYLCSALISVLEAASGAHALKGFVLWGMGTFAAVGKDNVIILAVPLTIGIILALACMKPLDALLLGGQHASTMGVDVRMVRRLIILITGILAGTCTAFCGPIAFLGLATPHIARGMLGTTDHRRVLPITMMTGAVLALMCNLVVRSFGPSAALPLNAVTALLGVPVIIWVLLRGRKWSRMGT